MKIKSSRYARIWYAVVGVGVGHALVALGGWTGLMNGTGFGKAAVNVVSSTYTTAPHPSKSNYVATPNMSRPSAAITNTLGYAHGGPLPAGASSKTVARIKGSPGLIWQAKTTGFNGDRADNDELLPHVEASSPLATTSLEFFPLITNGPCGDGISSTGVSYTFTWSWSGSDRGVAQRLKWVLYDGIPPDDFNGDISSLPGALVKDTWLQSTRFCECPEYFDETNSYTLCVTNLDAVWIVTDGIAVSIPCQAEETWFERAHNLTLKIRIADLLGECSDVLTFVGVGASVEGATILTNATHIFYTLAPNVDDRFTYSVSNSVNGTITETNINIYVTNPGGIAHEITASGGMVTVKFAGIPGITYEIQRYAPLGWCSTCCDPFDLNGWSECWNTVDTRTAPPNGLFTYTESISETMAFYRLRQQLVAGSLSGVIYEDKNQNGVYDAGDGLIQGTTVEIEGPNIYGDYIFRDTVSDVNGAYTFGGLYPSPGGYTLFERQPNGYTDGPTVGATVSGISVGSLGGNFNTNFIDEIEIINIRLDAGQHGINYNFGESAPSSFSPAHRRHSKDSFDLDVEALLNPDPLRFLKP